MKYSKTTVLYRLTGVLIITLVIIFAFVVEEMVVVKDAHSRTPIDVRQLEYGMVD